LSLKGRKDDRDAVPKNPAKRITPEIIEKLLHLRKTYRPGPIRIVGYMARYRAHLLRCGRISHSEAQWPQPVAGGTQVHKIHARRHQKQVPGHRIRVDVKFLKFEGKDGKPVMRYQYTAIDVTPTRAFKIHDRHNPSDAIDFINITIDKLPFRIREVRTDNGHEFQAQFRWHVEDLGIRHAYIKPASP
jgi:hypothetical protein